MLREAAASMAGMKRKPHGSRNPNSFE